jgi:hypothetical protein
MLIKKSSNHFIIKENFCNMNRKLKGQFRPQRNSSEEVDQRHWRREGRAPNLAGGKVSYQQKRDSDIKLVGVADGKPFPLVPADLVLSSSGPLGWRGIVFERQRLEAQEMPQHYVRGHGLMISTAKRPVVFGWKENDRWHEGQLNPDEFHLITHGGFSAPRWPETFETVTLSLDPRFVADVAINVERVNSEIIQKLSQSAANRIGDQTLLACLDERREFRKCHPPTGFVVGGRQPAWQPFVYGEKIGAAVGIGKCDRDRHLAAQRGIFKKRFLLLVALPASVELRRNCLLQTVGKLSLPCETRIRKRSSINSLALYCCHWMLPIQNKSRAR